MSKPWDFELVAIMRAQAEDDQSQYGREAKTEAADEIERLGAEVERLTSERDELLAACRAFLARYHNKMVDARFVFGDVADMAEAAIAKATGEPGR